jgi:hypothetical protein
MIPTLTFTGARYRNPPLVDLIFDAAIENTSDRPLWLVLPGYLREDASPRTLLVNSVEVLQWNGDARIRLAHFFGNDGLRVLRLAPGAHVTLRGLPISCMRQPPNGPGTIDVIVAEELTIGPQKVEEWLPVDIMCGGRIQTAAVPGVVIAAKDSDDRAPLPLTPSGESRLKVHVEFGDSKASR